MDKINKNLVLSCQNCKTDFEITSEDLNFYTKIKVPIPTFCPECRVIRRMLHRNEHTLYKRKCDLTGIPIISIFNEDSLMPVCDQKFWRSDSFDASNYYLSLDFSRPFFEQYFDLLKKVPLPAVALEFCINSPFNHYCTNLKNCYYCFRSHRSTNIFYTYNSRNLEDCSDCYDVNFSRLLYECIDTHNSELSFYIENGDHISRSSFLYNCRNCVDCFMSSNLSGKQYFFKNKKLSREEYKCEIKKINFQSNKIIQNLLIEFYKLKEETLQKGSTNINTINSHGLNLRNCKNVNDSFYAKECENIRFGYFANRFKESYDIYAGSGNELTYETAGVGHSSMVFFSSQTTESLDVYYTIYADDCKHLFGCIGLQKKEYFILNKKYSKEEYDILIPKIIKHMNDMPYIDKKGNVYRFGEFFPSDFSLFAYNETIAQDYFSLKKEDALQKGYKWREENLKNYQTSISINDIPNNIEEIPDSIINEIIPCEDHVNKKHIYGCDFHCSTAFKITKGELELYRRMNLPLPRKCPQCRFYRRLKIRSLLKRFNRKCMKEGCNNEFETSYSPNSKEKIFCDSCYNKEIY